MKLYKFYKDDCIPCKTLSKILKEINIPANIEIIDIDVKKNMDFALENKISGVPTLMHENGNKLIGLKTKTELISFISGTA